MFKSSKRSSSNSQQLLTNAPFIGFDTKSTLKACCGTGGRYNFNFRVQCGISSVPVCPDPDKYISWDGTHLTQKANRLVATWLVADFLPKIDCNMYWNLYAGI
ncbi:hypothetical protein AgCh_037682 [Apium graveolens]